jgi:leader peptidase (prepilin peptidase)/N-methyltransferase
LRYPIVELAVGVTWSIIAWRMLDPSGGFSEFLWTRSTLAYLYLIGPLAMMAFDWTLIGLAVLDAEHLWIPDRITLPGIIIGILFPLTLMPQMSQFFIVDPGPWKFLITRSLSALAAAALILLIRWIYWLFRRREGIGLGDAKLMAMLAAWLGLPGALLSFGLGVTLGAFVAVILLIVQSKGNQPGDNPQTWALTKLPLGTFLCVGGIITSLWGQRIINAYLHWAGF